MGLSKSNRILILLAIDSLFFLLEIVVGTLFPRTKNRALEVLMDVAGYAVHSLALVADSFHMVRCESFNPQHPFTHNKHS